MDNSFNELTNRARLGIRGRLLMGFAAITLIVIVAVSATLYRVSTSERATHYLTQVEVPTYADLLKLSTYLYYSQALLRGYFLTNEDSYKTELQPLSANIENLVKKIDVLSVRWRDSKAKQDWFEVKNLVQQFLATEKKLINEYDLNDREGLIAEWKKELLPLSIRLTDLLEGQLVGNERMGGVSSSHYQNFLETTDEVATNMTSIKYIMAFVLGFCVLMALVISYVTARQILTPLNYAISIAKNIASGKRDNKIVIRSFDETGQLLEALDVMQNSIVENEEKLRESEIKASEVSKKILLTAQEFRDHSSKVASGDLTKRLSETSINEMSQLGSDLNLMTESLANMTKQITQACHNMVTSLEEVKRAVHVQSSGATEQASSINEITASLAEIEKSSSQTMEKAISLGQVAEITRTKGQQGLQAVEQSINGMKAIRDKVQLIAQTILDLSAQTQQVGEITTAVNNLAQQSKMLALNASIEAAKAGEAGKGFAVVATEVKTLAEQSEQSTAQVQKILEDIRIATEKAVIVMEDGTKGVDQGTTLVEQTGEIVRNLSDVIYETSLATQQIEAAIRQEGVGIEQITTGMNEINQVTHSFVDSANQTLEAINHLTDIAKRLKDQIDTYKV